MTVKEYIKMTEGISRIDIYDKNGEYVEVDCSASKIVNFVDNEVSKVVLSGTITHLDSDGKKIPYVKTWVSIHLADYDKKENSNGAN